MCRQGSHVEFLRREVYDLERVIKAMHSLRSDDSNKLAQVGSLLTRAREEGSTYAGQQQQDQRALADLRERQAATVAVAAARETEIRMLTVALQLLCTELLDAEAEREAARESESSALSIARSYRGFATQGAARLEEMCGVIAAAQTRFVQRLSRYEANSQHCFKLRALRSIFGWRTGRDLSRCLARWMLLVFTAEHRATVAARLEAAYRHRDVEIATERIKTANARRDDHEALQASKAASEAKVVAAQRERDEARQLAQVESEARQRAEKANEALRGQLAEAHEQRENARKASAADLAAAREQLVATRREASAAKAPILEAREAQRVAEASMVVCCTVLADLDVEAAAARVDAAGAHRAREEEARMRHFLERVLKDERSHTSRRTEEAASLRALLDERRDVERSLAQLSELAAGTVYELHATYLGATRA